MRGRGGPEWVELERKIVACRSCPRLIEHCRETARVRRRAYRDEQYWGRPVPGFGSPRARILLVGLAPAAHGANRTGRMFTGDRSGEWLYGALHRAGLASQPQSTGRDDGMRLRDVFISAVCRCAPPGNRPSREEMTQCEPFLDRELDLLSRMKVTLALGKIAWDAVLRRAARVDASGLPRPRPAFGHAAETQLRLRGEGPRTWVVGSYHPSQQNTQTGRLTRSMFDSALRRAMRRAGLNRV